MAEHHSIHDHMQRLVRLYKASQLSSAGLCPRIPLARKPRLGARARASHEQCWICCWRVGCVPWMAEDCPVPRNASAWRLRAIVVDRRVSQRFWLKSARARRFFRSQRPRYFGIVPGTTAKARPPFITLFLDSSGSKSARAGRGSAIAAAGAIPKAAPLHLASR